MGRWSGKNCWKMEKVVNGFGDTRVWFSIYSSLIIDSDRIYAQIF